MTLLAAAATAYITHHVVLPPQLPQSDDYDAAHERALIEMTIHALEDMKSNVNSEHITTVEFVIATVKNLRDSRDAYGNVSEVQLGGLLAKLVRGANQGAVPLEIKEQNAAIIATRSDDYIVFEFLELSPTNKSAMQSGRLIRSFPAHAACIPVKDMTLMDLRTSIAATIAKMSTQTAPGLQPQIRKNNKMMDEARDTSHPGLVTDFLMNVITALGETTDVHRIIKNTREDVLWSDALSPWRRSPLWLLLRVSLQLLFARKECQVKYSDGLYKSFMIFLLARLLQSAENDWKGLGSELIHAISAKLIRRLRKFELSNPSHGLQPQWNEAIHFSIMSAHTHIQGHWHDLTTNIQADINMTLLRTLQPEADLNMTLPGLDACVSEIVARQSDASLSTFKPTSTYTVFADTELPESFFGSGEDSIFRLSAFERWVEHHRDTWLAQHMHDPTACGKIRHLMESYHAHASARYTGMPVSISIMYLTLVELWIACDTSASAIYPMLRKYDPEISLIELQCLALPLKSQMKRLDTVERYVASRQNAATKGLPSLYRDFGKSQSFAVRYFEQCESLQKTLNQIESEASAKRQRKCDELRDLQDDYERLMRQYNNSVCENETHVYNHYHGYTRTQHKTNCSRCSYKRRADGLTIQIFEWPVSSVPSVAKATIFELEIPEVFSAWRDTSAFLITSVLGFQDAQAQKPRCTFTLDMHPGISHRLSSQYHGRRIVPLSSIKPHAVTHRKHQKAIQHLQDHDVCLNNALQYEYYDRTLAVVPTGTPKGTGEIPKKCAYHMPQRAQALERYMRRFPASPDGIIPNEVMASLSDCPQHFSIDEYKALCSLPLGHQLLYSNTLVQLAMPAVDFTKVETQCFLLQIVQQVGLPNNQIERASHRILKEESLGFAMLKQLDIAVQRIAENWESWRATATFSLLTRRLLSFSSSREVRKHACQLLTRLRQVCMKWLGRLRERAASSADDDQRTELYSRATEIALVCTTTYDVEDEYVDIVLREPSAVSILLRCSITIQENNDSVLSEHQALYKSMLHSWRAMMYRVLPKLRASIFSDGAGLCEAVIASWAAFLPAPSARWVSLPKPQEHWLQIPSGELQVHLNLLTAELLIKGLPLARLPAMFMQHPMYIPLFQKSTIAVAPTDQPGMSFGAMDPYHDYYIQFGMQGQDMLVVATKHDVKLDLLPLRLFKGQLPEKFCEDYIPFYDHSRDEVIFRPRAAPWFSETDGWRLQHNTTNTWRLTKGSSVLVNMTSRSARGLSKMLRSLEDPQHIHVVLDPTTQTIDIELPRLQLAFFVEHQGDQVHSRQYRGMFIDNKQSIGSLVGLASKLVLKNDQRDRMIVVPVPKAFDPSSVKYAKCSQHVSVFINKDYATKVYAYSIDACLGRIIDSGDLESKLYMAYLHALTSHCLPDILTKVTGVESSLQILRSAAVRSFDLLTEQNVELLTRIGGLSTSRVFYPPSERVMQNVQWDKSLPALTQHPVFRTVVMGLFEQATEMRLFFPEEPVYDLIETTRRQLLSESLLGDREASRTSTFRVAGFGAEKYSTCQDTTYDARDQKLESERSRRVIVASTLILRDQLALSGPISDLKSSLLQAHFNNATVNGVDDSFKPSDLRYDSKWLQKSTTHLTEKWCSLQQGLANASSSCNKYDVLMWVATLSYATSADMIAIQALVAFYKSRDFAAILPPSALAFDLSSGSIWNTNAVTNIIYHAQKPYDSSGEARLPKKEHETDEEHDRRIRQVFENHRNTATQKLSFALKQQWPVQTLARPNSRDIDAYIDLGTVMANISAKCEGWYDNRKFLIYLQNLSTAIARRAVLEVPLLRYHLTVPSRKANSLSDEIRHSSLNDIFSATPPSFLRDILGQTTPTALSSPCEPELLTDDYSLQAQSSEASSPLQELCQDLESYAKSKCEKDYVQNLRASCTALDQHLNTSGMRKSLVAESGELLERYLHECEQHFDKINDALKQCVTASSSFSGRIGMNTQHAVRISPQFWLSQLHRNRFTLLSEAWKIAIIEFGLAITRLHRAQRLVALVGKPIDLAEELRHVGHTNWSPCDHPESLLLEAESGIMIREEQEFIANEMRMKSGDNMVLQLLMGGGKSTTIVPLLSAYFSDKEKLVRVIVAKPQSKQMLQMLVQKLGGLLNRRIYHMPFSRNLKMTLADANTIHQIYEECVATQGVLMVLPEQVLSFKLMATECLITDKPQIARSLLSTLTFFDKVTRDIVDESDENFSTKFELIYTMGAQQSIELAPERWLIIQEIMGLLPRFAAHVRSNLPDAVDIQDNGDGKFPRVRLLRQDATDQLLELLARHIVEFGISGLPSRSQSPTMQAAILQYITQTELSDMDIQAVEGSLFWTDSTKSPLLLVRGLIAGGVLRFVFGSKRWRVSYGLDLTRNPVTNLAVPYRSKDSPSPRSEFSHPDVVILLTQLSYYYGGLSDEELFDTFTHVLKSDQSNIHYDEFVTTASSTLPAAFRTLSGVSIRDRHQCITEVFPALRNSKKAIDYFLSYLIFPKQLKEFPSKLSSSGWDLGMTKSHPTTGFSGTNDTLHLLPLEVKHVDLPSQKHTNAQVLAYLLKKETSIELLPPRTDLSISDGEHLLTVVQNLDMDVRVVLDCGASILEQNNKQVAQTWLAMCGNEIQAVVYFEDEQLSVLDRLHRVEPFQTSPFAKNLDVCVVYLDEAHTRGTDLKLPRNYRAAVTLGSQLTKDRLTQACMRLRKLGHGQSVTFIVPDEISTKIRELTRKPLNDPIQVRDVLCWSISECWADLRRSMPLWAVQGNRYESHKHLLHGADTTKGQAQAFLEDEAQALETRYRPRKQNDDGSAQILHWNLSNTNIAQIVSRCRDFEAMGFNSAALSEEQERELAPEIEEERQIERPPRMGAEKHDIHADVLRLARLGELAVNSSAFEPAFQALRSTSAAKLLNLSAFPSDLLVTKDFMRTVRVPLGSTRRSFISDAYQRPVQFVLSVPTQVLGLSSVKNCVIISPYEANRLLTTIRLTKKVTMHIFAARSNTCFAPLDELMLYNIGHAFSPGSISRSLTMQLNLFAGSLYLRSFTEYSELCDFLGLLRTTAMANQQVHADGFIDPPTGIWGLKESAVPFLRALLMKIRREGEGVKKTHLGRILNAVRLEECDFEEEV